jgi:hypothetical protein
MKQIKSEQLLIFIDSESDRLEYIFKLVLNGTSGLSFKLTCDMDEFNNSPSPGFSYSRNKPVGKKPHISPQGLLHETDMHYVDIEMFELNETKAFFKSCNHSFFPFDIFSASFYLITRYEEYLPFNPDKHGRFPAKESLAFKQGFLDQPLINIWAEKFCFELCRFFPILKPVKQTFCFLSTIDVDNAWAHLHKGFARTFLSFLNLLIRFDLKGFCQKLMVVFLKHTDPYDNYRYIKQIHAQFGYNPIYFILCSAYSKYDKNPSPKNKHFKNLIKKLAINDAVGLHPSFQSNKDTITLLEEKVFFGEIDW